MDIKTRLTRCCNKPIGGDNCREGLRCSDCFDKLEGWREIENLERWRSHLLDRVNLAIDKIERLLDAIADIKKHMRQVDRYGLKESTQQILDNVKDDNMDINPEYFEDQRNAHISKFMNERFNELHSKIEWLRGALTTVLNINKHYSPEDAVRISTEFISCALQQKDE